MPGGNHPKPSHSSFNHHSDHRKSRWEGSSSSGAGKSKPSPKPTSNPQKEKNPAPKPIPANPKSRPEKPSPRPDNPSSSRPVFEPPPPPSYGFHMLERRTIVLVDGSVRSYFALPPDYENFKLMSRPGIRPDFPGPHGLGLERPHLPMSPEFRHPDARAQKPEHWNSWKRKFGEDERDDGLERQRQQLLQYGNVNGPGSSSAGYGLGRGEERAAKSMRIHEGSTSKLRHNEVDQSALRKAFLHFAKTIFESHKKNYLADGKHGHVPCLACSRSDSPKVL